MLMLADDLMFDVSCCAYILLPRLCSYNLSAITGTEHLTNYHKWMQDPSLLDATASEPLTMEEEVDMQISWRDDERKCTFIILARDLLDCSSGVPPPPRKQTEKLEISREEEQISYPNLVNETLHAMIGDINLFLSEEEPDTEGEEQPYNTGNIQSTTCTEQLSQAELDIMIAESSHRHKGLGVELALTMMHYGAFHLHIRRFFVKIKNTNNASLKLFREKLGFVQCAYAECFGEYELECKCERWEEMVKLIEDRWVGWNKKKGSSGDSLDEDGVDTVAYTLYNVYDCPLSNS